MKTYVVVCTNFVLYGEFEVWADLYAPDIIQTKYKSTKATGSENNPTTIIK